MAEAIERRLLILLLVLALVAGIVLRFWQLGHIPLWLDEAYTAFAANKDMGFILRTVRKYETHPPLYYAIMHYWVKIFGDSLLALRAVGEIAGLLTLPALVWPAREAGMWLGWEARRRFRLEIALVALGAVSIPLVEMAREVRPYPLMILDYALAIGCALHIARRVAAGDALPKPAFAAYVVFAVTLGWAHTLGPLWIVALTLASAVALSPSRVREDWIWWLAGHALIAILYSPAAIIALDQAPTWIRSSWLRFSFGSSVPHLLVLYAVPGWQSIVALALMAMGGAAVWRLDRRLLAMLAVLALVPVILSLALSATIAPVFITRTMTPVAVPALLLVAIGATAFAGRLALIGAGLAAILGANLLAVGIQTRLAGPPQDWYRAIGWLNARWKPGDLILAYPNEGALPLRRALRDWKLALPILSVPSEMPALDVPGATYPTGSRGVPTLPRAMLRATAADPAFAEVPTIWLLRLGAHTYDPGDAFLRELLVRRRPVARYDVDPIDIIGLTPRTMPRQAINGTERSTAARR